MKPQAMNIIKMISKPMNERMPFEGVQLTKFVQKLPFFRKFFPHQSQKFISLCMSATLLQFEVGQSLYSKQSHPDCIYILVEGTAEIISTSTNKKRNIHSYDIVGHVQIAFALQKRQESIKILTRSWCMVVKAEDLLAIWDQKSQVLKAFSYLCSNHYFDSLSIFDKQSLSLLMEKKNFKNGGVVSQQSQINCKLIFVIYGEILVIRKIMIKNKQKDVILENLQQMDSFGEYQVSHNQTSEVSLVAASPGVYYQIDINDLRAISHPLIEVVQARALPYPDKEELQFRYSVQAEVQKFQTKIKKRLNLNKK